MANTKGTHTASPMNAKFDMSAPMIALATNSAPARDAITLNETVCFADAHPEYFQSKTPMLNTVYNMIQESEPPKEPLEPALGPAPLFSEARPKIPGLHSSLGISRPNDLPEQVTPKGVHIYAENVSIANGFAKIVKDYNIWVDRSMVDILKDQQLKIPLVDGWQNASLGSRSYPLGRKDIDFLNTAYDKLHEQGKMEWVDEPTPFAHPLFVVWRTVNSVTKGRVVVNLRPLNKIAIPDNYPLPLQAQVIAALRSKRYLTIVNATSFFN
jgi:hypothetical protein